MAIFDNWLTNLMKKGLGVACNRYYSIYRGTVTDNKDPDSLGRVKILCPQVGQTAAPDRWVLPATMGGGNRRGMFFVPEVDDTVWVSFYEGDHDRPEVYWGGWYGEVDPTGDEPTDVPIRLAPKPKGAYPEKKGFTTRAGHSLIFNDEDGKESITIQWNQPADGDPAKTDPESLSCEGHLAAYLCGYPWRRDRHHFHWRPLQSPAGNPPCSTAE